MTLVVTHTGGFLGCFTTEPDGSVRQRALIDTGSDSPSPQEIAEQGIILANHYGWSLNGSGIKPAPVKKALKKPAPVKAEVSKYKQGYVHRSYPPVALRESMILECLKKHPASTIHEILEAMEQPTDNAAKGNWNHTVTALRSQHRISRTGTGHSGDPYRYSLSG